MVQRSRGRLLSWIALAASAVAMITWMLFSSEFQVLCCAKEWRRFAQPGGDLVIIVYRLPQLFAMPGASSDAAGVVRLVKPVGGREVVEQSTYVEMIQNVSEPEWTHDRVTIKLIADWPLPP